MFMDDLKLYAAGINQLNSILEIVMQFSQDIQMKFGLEKCKIMTMKKGKKIEADDITLSNDDKIKALNGNDQYKYLGMHESDDIKINDMKNKLQTEYFARLKKIMKTSLNSKNTIEAINTFAVPALSYDYATTDH